MSKSQRLQSFGEKAAGCGQRPEAYMVGKCRKEFADVIDRMNYLRQQTTSAEVKRMATLSIDHAQVAQMWAVKAITEFE